MTRSDFDETHYRGTGNGGQARNKTSSGVRLVHRDSGAVGESANTRSQVDNRAEAFRRLRTDPRWTAWFRTQLLVAQGRPTLEQRLEEAMRPEHIRTQVREDDRWVDVQG